MTRNTTLGVAVALFVGLPGGVSADQGNNAVINKIGSALKHVYAKSTAKKEMLSVAPAGASQVDELLVARMTTDGYVLMDAVAAGATDDLVATIESLGGRNVSSYHRTVSAEFPPDRLAELAASSHLAFANPVISITNVGAVTGQGDRAMQTDIARADFGIDGSGLTIGILSDSFSCATSNINPGGPFTTTEEDITSGDLPADIINLADLTSGCIDEGRAMGQLIFDIVPGSALAFHTAFNGQADFAQGIIELAQAGADVIVDDVIYFSEPMFQDGIIAQAADEVARLGIPYYSANGNSARNAFQSEYRAVEATIDTTTGIWHDFDDGPGVDLLKTVTFSGSRQTILSFQWDNPNFSVSGPPGAQTDVDVIMFDANGVRVAECFDEDGNFVFPANNGLCQFQFTEGGVPVDGGNGGDAIETLSLIDFNDPAATVQIGLLTDSGPAPGFFKYVILSGGFAASEYSIDAPSGFGHNNAAGAEGIGASAFFYTEEFIGDPQTFQLRAAAGEPECIPACLNPSSSAGGTPILFDTAGNRLPQPEVRLKPGLTAPDGTNTTFFTTDTFLDDDNANGIFQSNEPGEFPNFFGTSAAAPHAAAVAALLIDAEDSQVKTASGEFRMCRPDDDDGDDDDGGREDGDTELVQASQVTDRIAQGWLLGPCSRTEPQEIYDVMRSTARDMSVRGGSAGQTLQIFDEVGPGGFDFDSGFGFIDPVAALTEFTYDDDDN